MSVVEFKVRVPTPVAIGFEFWRQYNEFVLASFGISTHKSECGCKVLKFPDMFHQFKPVKKDS